MCIHNIWHCEQCNCKRCGSVLVLINNKYGYENLHSCEKHKVKVFSVRNSSFFGFHRLCFLAEWRKKTWFWTKNTWYLLDLIDTHLASSLIIFSQTSAEYITEKTSLLILSPISFIEVSLWKVHFMANISSGTDYNNP